jgi:flagellar protein FliJ
MKKFKFNLETLLKLKKKRVDEEVRKLSLVVGQINKLRNEVNENNKMIQEQTNNFSSQVNTDINLLRIFDGYVKTLIVQNERLLDNVKEQDGNYKEAVGRVVEVRKHHKVYELLKEKRLLEYNNRMFRAERSEEDETNLKDFLADRRELRHDSTTAEVPKPKVKVPKKVPKDPKKGPQNEYEKLLEYYNQFKPKK